MTQLHRRMQPSTYQQWIAAEGIDVVPGHHVPDLRALPVKPWSRTGGSACFINHDDSDRSNDCVVEEIPAGGSLTAQRHLHERMVYVLSGRGTTAVWQEGAAPQSFEWQEGSLFAVPLNACYQHFNSSGDTPVRLLSVTNLPAVMNMFADPEFVFRCPYEFTARFSGEGGYFNGEGTLEGRAWESNFIPDARKFELLDYKERGAGGKNIQFKLAGNTMGAHISEFPVGTYKKAHRHGPGAHVVILNGSGYSLMWKEGESPRRYDWQEGSMIIPPDRAFHQHFNTGGTPARYLALRYTVQRDRQVGTGLPMSSISTRVGGDQIDYEDEDPQTRAMYEQECRRHGVDYKMAPFFAS
jgi:oxalate decarboxylase/phosphoglucose isomerase-like protein (cupin superfamily)